MAKSVYIGVDNLARKVKRGYVGVDNTARKIRKGYIGVGGIARPFWSGGQAEYYGTATPLTRSVSELAATTVGDYALFAGGLNITLETADRVSANVDVYNSALVRSATAELSTPSYSLAATTVGDYALFGGGSKTSASDSQRSDVDVYDANLVKSIAADLSTVREELSATTVGDYALFGGGSSYSTYDGTTFYSNIDAYNSELVKSTVSGLSARECLAATTVGDYALFGGGYYWSSEKYVYSREFVYAWNIELVKSTAANLSSGRYNLAATTVGDYALFGGGYRYVRNGSTTGTGGYHANVDIYDANLVKSVAADLSEQKQQLAATTLGNYALFGGGDSGGYHYYSTVDRYDVNLVKDTIVNLSETKSQLAAITVGDYALFGGGMSYSTDGTRHYYQTVDVYMI